MLVDPAVDTDTFNHFIAQVRYVYVSLLLFNSLQLQKGANDARSDDVRRAKEEIANWINQTLSPTTPLSVKQRDDRGLQNEITGRLLCPIELSWDDIEYTTLRVIVSAFDIFFCSVRRKIQTAELDISEDYFLTCLYPKGYGNPDDVEHGFLRSGLLLKVCKTCIPTRIGAFTIAI